MTVRTLFINQKNFKKYDGEIGIEIETETKKQYTPPEFFFWDSKTDGSLRDFGIEYVLKQPIKHTDVKKALVEFSDKTGKIPFIKDSFSTSVHVHLNMLEEDVKTMANFIVTYFIFENLLIHHAGPTRRSNLFCLPVCDAEETFEIARSLFTNVAKKDFRFLAVPENSAKYAALNISALGRFGSLEVRSFRGETDIEKIEEWVDLLYKILEYSRKMPDPKAILGEFRTKNLKLKEDVFGPLAKVFQMKNQEELIEKNIYYAASVAFSVKDWAEVEIPEVPPFKPTTKELESGAKMFHGKEWDKLSAGEQEMIFRELEKAHRWNHFQKYMKPQKKVVKKNTELAQALAEAANAGQDIAWNQLAGQAPNNLEADL